MEYEMPLIHNIWFDNGTVNFYDKLKRIEKDSHAVTADLDSDKLKFKINDKDKFIDDLVDIVKKDRDSTIFFKKKDEETGKLRKVMRDHILIQYAPKKSSINGLNNPKERSLHDRYMKDIFEEGFNILEENTERNKCVMCGNHYSKRFKELKQGAYPFVTKIKSLSGVRIQVDNSKIKSLRNYIRNFCPLCYFIGTLEWTDQALIYQSFMDSYSVFILPEYDNLLDLYEAKRWHKDNLNTDNRNTNVYYTVSTEDTERGIFSRGTNSLLLLFFESLIKGVFSKTERTKKGGYETNINKNWLITKIPKGQLNNLQSEKIMVPEKIRNLIVDLFKKDVKLYQNFLNKTILKSIDSHQKDKKATNDVIESLSETIIEDDFNSFASLFVPRERMYIDFYPEGWENLKTLIYEWRWKNMSFSKEQLAIVKKAGNTIATIAEDKVNIIYKIDRSRGLTELLDGLREASRRVINIKDDEVRKYISPTAVEDLTELLHEIGDDREVLNELKSTLIIFISMSFAKGQYRENQNN